MSPLSPSRLPRRNESTVLASGGRRSRLLRTARAEDGQSLVLAIGLCAITLLTISVVLAASAVNLKARQLLSVADGAIVAAVDEFEFVADGGQPRIELNQAQVQAAVQRYLQDVDAGQRVDNLAIGSVQILPDGQGARLSLTGSVQPPIIGWIVPSGVNISVNSSARTVLSR
ncbi:pilus assembly protein TadG-related protein [Glutamicibacter sp. 363]